jgi:hypothetical protein
MATPKKPKSKKHPKDMTTEEAIKHIFHPKIVKHLKTHAKTHGHKPTKAE